MEESGKKIARVLLNAALVTEEVLVKAQDQQKKTRHRLTEVLIALGVNAEAIRQALATHLKVPEISLQDHNMDSETNLGDFKMIRKGAVTPRSVRFLPRKTVKISVKPSGFLTVSILWAATP